MPPAFVLSQNQTLMFMSIITARHKTPPQQQHLWEPFLHNIQVCMHIETVNDLALTDHTQPRGSRRPEPPPTCPFIHPTMREIPPTPISPSLFREGPDQHH